MRRQLTPLLIGLLLAGCAVAQDKPAISLPTEETVNSFLHQTFGYDSSITWKVASIKPSEAEGLAEVVVVLSNPRGQQVTTLFVTPDGKHALNGELMPFGAKPYQPAYEALKKGVNGVARGPADSPVLIVEFSDLQCPHCKVAEPIIEKLLGDEPQARFVYQQYPLPSHDWAAKAAAYADCVGRTSPNAFWKFVQGTFADQSGITESNAGEKLAAIADQAGVKGSDIAACAAKPQTKTRLDKSVALGQEVGVNATPTVFINGRKIGNVVDIPYDTLKGLVEFAAKH
jgi:protein-disulfide isomerase